MVEDHLPATKFKGIHIPFSTSERYMYPWLAFLTELQYTFTKIKFKRKNGHINSVIHNRHNR